jgi:hypothetical protein
MPATDHPWTECNPVIRIIDTNEIDDNATAITRTFTSQLTADQRRTFHQALCYNSAAPKHRIIMKAFQDHLKKNGILP